MTDYKIVKINNQRIFNFTFSKIKQYLTCWEIFWNYQINFFKNKDYLIRFKIK